jgi:predicted dehydrogenase
MTELNPSLLSAELSVAVVGSGYWGKNLVRNYHQLSALKIICDKNKTILANFKNQYPNMDVCLAVTDVLSLQDISAVVIAAPAETHFTLARETLLANKHVYVEKPLVLNEEEAEELITLADSRHLILMV